MIGEGTTARERDEMDKKLAQEIMFFNNNTCSTLIGLRANIETIHMSVEK